MVTCEHCEEEHADGAKFCAATGKPMTATTERVRPLGEEKGVFDLLVQAVAIYRENPGPYLAMAAVLFVPGAFLAALAAPLEDVGWTVVWLLGQALVALVLYGLTLPLTQAAMTVAVADRLLGGPISWRDAWLGVGRQLPLLLSAVVPGAALLSSGFALGMVPGFVLAFFFIFVAPVVLLEGLGGLAALRRSARLVRADWLRTAIMLLAFGLTRAIAHGIASIFVRSGAWFAGELLGDLLLLLALPVPLIGSVLLYLDLRRTLDDVTDDQLRARMESLRG
jgi:hypothetical protein